MKKYAYLVTLLLLTSYVTNAQIVVHSQNKCYPAKVEQVLKSVTEDFSVFLNAQVDEGNLVNWGVLTHAWGDEWNFNIYYSAENMEKFQSAFSAAVAGYTEKHPDGMNDFLEACFEHKDSIHRLAYAYPADDEE